MKKRPTSKRKVVDDNIVHTNRNIREKLGSKSPFKYTDTYTVKTVHNKIEYLYTLVINELDVPECNLIYEQPTEAESGTEIIIPVKNYHDFEKFKEAAKKQLMWFKNITFNNYTLEYPEILYEGKRIIITKDNITGSSWSNSYNQVVLLGNVPYEYTKGNNLNKRVVIKFNIGELQPTASREALDYNSTTIANYDLIKKEAQEELSDYVKSLTVNNDFKSDYVKSLTVNNDFKSYYETANSLDIDTAEYKGYTLNNFKDTILYHYQKQYWRKTVSLFNMPLRKVSINTIYFYDDLTIKETDVKAYARDNNISMSVIPKTSNLAIYDIIKEVANPLSSIITPQVITRQSRKGKISFTDIFKNESITLEISEFENKYLSKDKLVVFAKTRDEYLDRYSNYPFYHLRLTDTELNKLGLRENLIYVKAEKERWLWLLNNHKSFRKEFIFKKFFTKKIQNLIQKYKYTGSSISKYLDGYTYTIYSGIHNIPKNIISEVPILQKEIKIVKILITSLYNRENKIIQFKNDSNY